MSKYLAIDVGTKRVGIAVSDDLAIIASPCATLERENSINKIVDIIERDKVSKVIVGLPYLPNGKLGSQAEDVNLFVDQLRKYTNKPIVFENEVLTSVEAENRLKKMSKKRLVKGNVDAMAACIILESYMGRLQYENGGEDAGKYKKNIDLF